MNNILFNRLFLAIVSVIVLIQPVMGASRNDGQHDFDWQIGNWKGSLKLLKSPLTGSTEWLDYEVTQNVKAYWGGRAIIDEFSAYDPKNKHHINGLTLHMYKPQTKEWYIYWANRKTGVLAVPAMVGSFKNGRGEFYDQEEIDGRKVFVRYIWSDIKNDSAKFEQAYSADGGKTWEVNWIQHITKVKEQIPEITDANEPKDYDWMIGKWNATLSRLQNPLTGSTTWVDFEASQNTKKIWGGRCVIDDFTSYNPATKQRMEAWGFRLYKPDSKEWYIYWATANNGILSQPPTIGRFKDGRGEFYDHEEIGGQMVLVQYLWTNITTDSPTFVQSFSIDGGKTFEPNWKSTITRVKE